LALKNDSLANTTLLKQVSYCQNLISKVKKSNPKLLELEQANEFYLEGLKQKR
jgi:hypothetical protein